jgi:hypothetical protein
LQNKTKWLPIDYCFGVEMTRFPATDGRSIFLRSVPEVLPEAVFDNRESK